MREVIRLAELVVLPDVLRRLEVIIRRGMAEEQCQHVRVDERVLCGHDVLVVLTDGLCVLDCLSVQRHKSICLECSCRMSEIVPHEEHGASCPDYQQKCIDWHRTHELSPPIDEFGFAALAVRFCGQQRVTCDALQCNDLEEDRIQKQQCASGDSGLNEQRECRRDNEMEQEHLLRNDRLTSLAALQAATDANYEAEDRDREGKAVHRHVRRKISLIQFVVRRHIPEGTDVDDVHQVLQDVQR